MRVLGPALINIRQQKQIESGLVAEFDIPRSAVYPTAAARAQVGDRYWVREPYIEVKNHRSLLCDIHELVIGSSPEHLAKNKPEWIKPYFQRCRIRFHNGADMRRGESRATLEILNPLPDSGGWKCRLIMQNVDARQKPEVS